MAVAFLVSLSSSLFFVRVLATHYCEPFSSVSYIPVVVTLIVKAISSAPSWQVLHSSHAGLLASRQTWEACSASGPLHV